MEVFCQRLDQEFPEADFILTAPSVEYRATIVDNVSIRKKRYGGKEQITITTPSQYPRPPTDVAEFLEPMVLVTVLAPREHRSVVTELCEGARGEEAEMEKEIDDERVMLKWRMPLAEVAVDFFDELKRITR